MRYGSREAEEALEQVHEVVRTFKRVADVSDEEVGRPLGMSRQVAQQRMSGQSRWTIGELFVLAEFFEVPVELFLLPTDEAITKAINEHNLATLRNRRGMPARAHHYRTRRAHQPGRRSTCTDERPGQGGTSRAA